MTEGPGWNWFQSSENARRIVLIFERMRRVLTEKERVEFEGLQSKANHQSGTTVSRETRTLAELEFMYKPEPTP